MKREVEGSVRALAVAGLHPGDEAVYRAVLRASGASREHLTEVTGLRLDELDACLRRFVHAGLVRLVGAAVVAEPPAEVLGALIAAETTRLQRDGAHLDALRNLLPSLTSEYAAPEAGRADRVDVQALVKGDVVEVLRHLAEETTGELRWFRPDQWRLPVTRDVDALVAELVRSGRRSRVIYPTRVLEEAPEVVRSRADAGEEVRIVASVPTRASIFGEAAALVPDRWGASTGRRLLVREHSLVGALRALFDHMWDQAMSVPGLEGGGYDAGGARRLLLHELARGAKDEQIARTLAVSLRTVRRRIADIMAELGADSRFEAGVEAVRRGWL